MTIFPALAIALSLSVNLQGGNDSPTGGPQFLGLYTSTEDDLARPTAVTYDAEGRLWICDVDNRLIKAHETSGELVISFAWPPTSHPSDIAVDAENQIFICDRWNHAVFVADTFGKIKQVIGIREDGSSQLSCPQGIAVHAGLVYVTDTAHGDEQNSATNGGGRVAVFDSDGTLVRSIGNGVLQEPRDVCIDAEGRLLVVDSGLAEICIFDLEGNLEHRFGGWGWFPGQFSDPTSLASFGDKIFAADRENQRIQVFDSKGKPLYRIGTHAIRPRDGSGKLHYPSAIAVHPGGERLAVAEPMDGRVQLFGMGPGTKPAPTPGRPESTQPSPHYGTRWSLDNGLLAIPEPESHRILLFDMRLFPGQDPVRVASVGGFGSGLGFFKGPQAVFLGGSPPTLLVADRGNGRIVEVALDLSPEKPLEQTTRAANFKMAFDLNAWNRSQNDEIEQVAPIQPVDILRTEQGHHYVLCRANRSIFVFDLNWAPVQRFGHKLPETPLVAPTAISWNGDAKELAVCDQGLGQVQVFGSDGKKVRTFGRDVLRRPSGLSYQKDGSLLVVDRFQCELFHFAPDGALLSRRFKPGIDRAGLFGPTDVTVDSSGRLLILDHGNHRGMCFHPDGDWVTAFGSKLYTKPARLPNAKKSGDETE